MRESFRDDELRTLWGTVLESHTADMYRINSKDSKDKILPISYEEMDRVNTDFALNFLKLPEEHLSRLKEVLYGWEEGDKRHEGLLSDDFRSGKHNRVRISISSRLPDIKRDIRELRSEDLNTFLQVEGVVKRVSEVVPTVVSAAFQCSYCRETHLYPQLGTRILDPFRCDHCGKTKEETKFKFIPEKSIYYDTQIITVEEKPEFLRGAAQPARLVVHLEEELCGKNNPGDRVSVNGILKGKQKSQGPQSVSRQFDIFLDAMFIERESSEYEEVILEDDDVKAIKKAAKDPEIYSKLVKSVAPAVFGNEMVKEAVILQLFGGERKAFPDGSYIRGDIHVLLFGDPGCLIGDERIVLANGGILKIRDAGRVHLQRLRLPVQTGQGGKRDLATVFHSYHRQPIMEVVTESGKSIVGTYNHPLLVAGTEKRSIPTTAENPITGKRINLDGKRVDRWKRLDEMRLDDQLVVAPGIRCTITGYIPSNFTRIKQRRGTKYKVTIPDKVTPELGAFLGYMIGNGWIGKHKTNFRVSEDERELVGKLSDLSEGLFNVRPHMTKRMPKDSSFGDIAFKGRMPMYYYEIHSEDVSYNLSFLRENRVPDIILKSGDAVVSEFIKWLFTADGYVFNRERGRRAIRLKSSELELLRDVQILLLRFGIHSRIPGVLKERQDHILEIGRSLDITRFYDKIGFSLESKLEKLREIADSIKPLSRPIQDKLTERVIAVRSKGYADVYDIEVPKSHRFIANGIVSHNTAKSQILTYTANISPKSVYTSGKGSSAAGLTAAAVKDDLSEGRWTLEAGTLVLADGGLAAVDELDKMDREDSGAMHQAMEQQSVSISKAGINATLMSRCAVLGAANPKYGRFDETEPFTNQTDFPVTLLSRFDLIFLIVDRPGKLDNDMADYILKVHKAGETIAGGRGGEKVQVYPEFERDFLKKYIVYARKNSFPIMSPKAEDKIKKFYVEKRASSTKQGSVAITPRQLEALVRLSEASARVRLSDRVDEEDVQRATKLMESFLNQATVVNGIPDIDIVMSGYSAKDRKGAFSVLEIIKQLQESASGRRASLRDIREEAKKQGIDERQVERELKILSEKGEIIEVVTGFYRALER